MVQEEHREGLVVRVVAFPKTAEANPYNELLYRSVAALGVEVEDFDVLSCPQPCDLLHVHWPEGFLARRNPIAVLRHMKNWFRCLAAYKAQGTRIVWTAHNVRQHEGRHRQIERAFWQRFVPLVDGCICLSNASWDEVKSAHPQLTCPHTVAPHGHYRGAYPDEVTREQARGALGVKEDQAVFVNVGLVRPYKNIPLLIETFLESTGDDRLVIAGECFDSSLASRVRALAAKDDRITLHLRSVPNEGLQSYFRAADLAVLPFSSILNSGSALLALSFDVPVLVPALGSMPELQATVGTEWVMTYSGSLNPSLLAEARAWAMSHRRDRAPLGAFDWERIGEQTTAFYREILAK